MPKQIPIKIGKGKTLQEGYCLEESLAAWEDNGWTRADDGDSDVPEPAEED